MIAIARGPIALATPRAFEVVKVVIPTIDQRSGDISGARAVNGNPFGAQRLVEHFRHAVADDDIEVDRPLALLLIAHIDGPRLLGLAFNNQQPVRGTEVAGQLGLKSEIVVGGQTDFHWAYRRRVVISICYYCQRVIKFCQEAVAGEWANIQALRTE
jgi:hypothetical protein